MKIKKIKNLPFQENTHHTFFNEKNSPKNIDSFLNFPELSNYGITSIQKTQTGQLSRYNKHSSLLTSISKSLKTMTINSKNYRNYIGFHSNLTKEHFFKTIQSDKVEESNEHLIKKKNYLSIKLEPLSFKDSKKGNISFTNDKSNSLFLTRIKETEEGKKFKEKLFDKTKNGFNRIKFDKIIKTEKDFKELCEKNLFESKFLNKIGLKKIDMDNCFEEKQKNYKFFCEYIKKVDEFKDIFREENFHRNIKFNERTAIKKENMEFNLDIYSLCLKFFPLGNNKEKESQKLYFPFILMPLFYLLDFTSFKVLLSEIITFNKSNNCFEYIKEFLLFNIVKKFVYYIFNSLENNEEYINNITYNKKETVYPLIYDWIVSKNYLNEDEEEEDNININSNFDKNYRCFKLKIVLPKIKFSVNNLDIKIIKFLNKYIIANLLQNRFKNWEKFAFFDLFSTKRFRIITNLIMLNKYYKIGLKKIKLNKNYKIQPKDYEFFLTQIGDNYSIYYSFIPFIVLIVFGKKEKKFQKINLNMKESLNLVKFGQKWGMINTLFKCMFFDKTKDKIFFKFELLEDGDNLLYNTIRQENNKNDNIIKMLNLNNDINTNNDYIKKVQSRSYSIREKRKDKTQIRYKDSMYEISLLNCTLKKINITSVNSENNYYTIPQNMLNCIFNIKDINKIFNISLFDESLISKYIGENTKSILSAYESNNISEEQKMIKEMEMENDLLKDDMPKFFNIEKQNSRNDQNVFNRTKTLQRLQKANTMKREIKREEKVETAKIDTNVEKRYSNKYVFPRGIFVGRTEKKRVSITNSKELNQIRFENFTRDIRRKTMVLNKYNQ